MRRLPIIIGAAALLAGCGESKRVGAPDPDQLSGRLVKLTEKPPLVNGLDIDPQSGDFFLTTNKGFWRIAKDGSKVTRLEGTIQAEGKEDTVGTFLEIEPIGDGVLVGSGHPDNQDTLPQFLGTIRSDDNGQTWRVVSRLGEADLHKILPAHGKLYAFDAVLGAMLISDDEGKTFEERFTPRGLVIDFAVDPGDEDYILATTEDQMYRSEDGGRSWRPVTSGEGMRLAWVDPKTIVRADKDGTVHQSGDRGATWKPVGKVPGEPYKFEWDDEDPDHLYLPLSDGTIVESTDAGRNWKVIFKP